MNRVICILAAATMLSCSRAPTTVSASGNRSDARVFPTGGTGPVISYADTVDHVAPAVVTIRATSRVRAPQMFQFFDQPFLRQFFGGTTPREPQTTIQQALGSGVSVRADGYILTNHHVIDGAQDIKVDLSSGKTYSAKVVGSDAPSDLAVLKISADNLPILPLANSDQVRVGDVCLAVGNPMGLGETVTAGIVSAKGRSTDVGTGSFQDFLQTDAPINQGNSGGALVNTRGELIGINSQILTPNGGNIGIGFAIPSNMARTVMTDLIDKGKVQRAMMGVSVQKLTPDLASGLGLKSSEGVLIGGVNPGGPADKAGLKTGDVILKINGHQESDTNSLRNEIAAMPPGSDVTVTILRNNSQQDVHVKLGELTGDNTPAGQATGSGESTGAVKLGVSVATLTPDVARQVGVPANTQGVVVEQVDPGGAAAQAGIQAGDVIQQVNRQPVRSTAELRDALAKSKGQAPLLLVNRGGQTAFVVVSPE